MYFSSIGKSGITATDTIDALDLIATHPAGIACLNKEGLVEIRRILRKSRDFRTDFEVCPVGASPCRKRVARLTD